MTGFPGSSSFPGSSFPGSTPGSSPFPGSSSPFPGSSSPFPGSSSFPGSSPFPGSPAPEPFPGPGGAGSSSGAGTGPRPPLQLLVPAVLVPALSLLLLLTQNWVGYVVGWVVATFVTFGVLTAFTLVDTARRADAWYMRRDGLVSTLRSLALGLVLVAAVVHAYAFADWFSRLPVFAS